MKTLPAFLAACVLVAPSAAQAQAVETELTGVTAELIELRQASGLTRLAVRFANGGDAGEDSTRFEANKITVVDAKSKKKYLPLKDANGHWIAGPIGDSIGGGRVRLFVPPKGSTVVWAYFDAIPAGTVVSVQMPSAFPFDDVKVTEEGSKVVKSAGASSTPAGASATLVSAKRADQVVNVRLKLQPDPGGEVRLASPYFEYADVFLFDPVAKRKYPLMKDAEGMFQAQPLTVKMDGGSFVPDWNKAILMNLTFQAPPDTVSKVDLMMPHFLPTEGLAIEGLGGAATGGIAAAGTSLGLEGALKELNAEVTPAAITIDLSADVLFDFDKATIKKEAEPSLTNVATVLKANPGAAVSIEGHTDSKGGDTYNQTLSEQRAVSVKQWLGANGQVSAATISTRGWGETKPIAHNTKPDGTDDPDGRAKNRRVQIVIKKK